MKHLLIAAAIAAASFTGAQAQSVMDDHVGPPMPAAARQHANRVVAPAAPAQATPASANLEAMQPSWEVSAAWRQAHQYNTDNGQ